MDDGKLIEYQNILNSILVKFKDYAEKKDIKFFLIGGTLLGAIRHHGFIPWDDDIDIMIKREEYNKLLRCAAESPFIDEEHRYKILVPCSTQNYYYPFIKIVDTKTIIKEKNISNKFLIGAFVDVFCLDYWPEKTLDSKILLKKNRFYVNANKIIIGGSYQDVKFKMLEVVARPIRKIFNLLNKDSSYWCSKMISLAKYNRGNYAGNVMFPCGLKDRYPAEWFNEFIEGEFEKEQYMIPKEYDKILTYFYGDYMTLPSEENRVAHSPEIMYLD